LNFLLDNIASEELREGLGNFSLHEFRDALEGISGTFEFVEIFKGKTE